MTWFSEQLDELERDAVRFEAHVSSARVLRWCAALLMLGCVIKWVMQ